MHLIIINLNYNFFFQHDKVVIMQIFIENKIMTERQYNC